MGNDKGRIPNTWIWDEPLEAIVDGEGRMIALLIAEVDPFPLLAHFEANGYYEGAEVVPVITGSGRIAKSTPDGRGFSYSENSVSRRTTT